MSIAIAATARDAFSMAPGRGLVTDSEIKPLPEITPPGYLESYIDPIFGSKVTRITGIPGNEIPNGGGRRWPEVARHGYSKRPAWNADGSLLALERCDWLILDGHTYRPRFVPELPGDCRWHPAEPNRMIFVRDNVVGSFDVRTGTAEVIARFPGYAGLTIGPGEGNLSADGNRVALAGVRDGRLVGFAFDLKRGVKHPDIDFCRAGLTAKSEGVPAYMDWISVSAGGEFVVVNGNMDAPVDNQRGKLDRTLVFGLDGRQVTEMWTDYGRPSHYDMTVDDAGDEVAVGVSKSPPVPSKNSTHSRGVAIIVVEQATQPLPPANPAVRRTYAMQGIDDLPVQPLVISFAMIVCEVLVNRAPEMILPEENQPIRDFLLEREMKSFEVRIAVRRTRRRPHRAGTCQFEQPAKSGVKRRIAIHDEEPLPAQETAARIRQVAADLEHPGCFGMRG